MELSAKIRFYMYHPDGNFIGVLVKNLGNVENKESGRELFNVEKELVINKMIRFYSNPAFDLSIVLSKDGSWEGFKKPKGTFRIKPTKMELIFSDNPEFEKDQELSDNIGNNL